MRAGEGSFPFTAPGFGETVWLAFTEWGALSNPNVVVCVHGLTRQARDFDALGQALAPTFRTLCPDVVGRGRSAWLTDKTKYTYDTYVAQAQALLRYRGLAAVDWVGTSMGGLIGMFLAASPESPVRRLVLNDVGPFIPAAALDAIGAYVGRDPRFPSQLAVLDYLKQVHAGFGPMSEADWAGMVAHSVVRQPDRSYSLHYDPAIGDAFREPARDVDLWAVWERVEVPVLVLRGEHSGLLTAETAARMAERPQTTVVEIPGCGHAPSLTQPDQIAVVRDWLLWWKQEDEAAARAAEEALPEGQDGAAAAPH